MILEPKAKLRLFVEIKFSLTLTSQEKTENDSNPQQGVCKFHRDKKVYQRNNQNFKKEKKNVIKTH